MTFISYAQHGEDVVLWRALGDRAHVTYVDVGAYDPRFDSVTRALYERGWRGVNLEPQPDRLAAFERDRPEDINLAIAAGDRDGTTILTIPSNQGWATIHEPDGGLPGQSAIQHIEVPLRRLDTLLPELGIEHVDVLKIDAEGAEADVVRGLLTGGPRPTVCVVEGVAPVRGREAGDEAVRLLIDAGYLHCLFDGLNHYLTTDPALAPSLSTPASPVDDYVTDLVDRLMSERKQLHETVAGLAAVNASLHAAVSAQERTESVAQPSRVATPVTIRTPDPDAARAQAKEAAPETTQWPAPGRGAAESGPLPPGRPIIDPSERAARRRETVARLLAKGSSMNEPSVADPHVVRKAAPDIVELESAAPRDVIVGLFQAILGRQPEAEGLDAWAAHLANGFSVLQVAHELATSPEATEASPERRARTAQVLRRWEFHSRLREIGALSAEADGTHRPGHAADEIFVEALYEVALRRAPSADELRFEVDKLASGADREWMLRAFADRPPVRERLLGRPVRGPRSLVRRWRDGRTYRSTFRAMVVAAESRRVDDLVRRFHATDPVLTAVTRGGQ